MGSWWKIGAQLRNADPALAWRTPYLAEDVMGSYQGYAALKKVHPPNKTKGIVEALQEVNSLPHGKEISPYIALIIDGGIDCEFGWYVVTPYYENGTLQRRMKAEQPLTLGTALTITEQILSGLLAAFTLDKKNLVHFDIKPSNIAFDNEGNVRIIDWGLSEVLNSDYWLTISGSPGTPVVCATGAGPGLTRATRQLDVAIVRHPRGGCRAVCHDHRPTAFPRGGRLGGMLDDARNLTVEREELQGAAGKQRPAASRRILHGNARLGCDGAA